MPSPYIYLKRLIFMVMSLFFFSFLLTKHHTSARIQDTIAIFFFWFPEMFKLFFCFVFRRVILASLSTNKTLLTLNQYLHFCCGNACIAINSHGFSTLSLSSPCRSILCEIRSTDPIYISISANNFTTQFK